MTSRPVVVVGDVGIDVITLPGGPIHWGSDTPASVRLVPGGAGANAGAWLAWAGMPVTVVARVGSDVAAQTVARDLSQRRVRTAFAIDPVLPTCCVTVIVDERGQRTMLADRGANRAFCPDDVWLADLPHQDDAEPHLHLSGYVLFDRESRDGGLEAIRQARELGWTISVDPQAASLVAREGADAFLSWVEGVDLLLPNSDELAALGGVEKVLEHVGEVVTTYGPNGARWVGDGFQESAQAPSIEYIDTTGAGDAFDAGLLSVWLSGGSRVASLRAGIEAGSTACQRLGARPS
jgi:sugar/nucleoside kinase (ribokinase family)